MVRGGAASEMIRSELHTVFGWTVHMANTRISIDEKFTNAG